MTSASDSVLPRWVTWTATIVALMALATSAGLMAAHMASGPEPVTVESRAWLGAEQARGSLTVSRGCRGAEHRYVGVESSELVVVRRGVHVAEVTRRRGSVLGVEAADAMPELVERVCVPVSPTVIAAHTADWGRPEGRLCAWRWEVDVDASPDPDDVELEYACPVDSEVPR